VRDSGSEFVETSEKARILLERRLAVKLRPVPADYA
jgi:hypothetical protein